MAGVWWLECGAQGVPLSRWQQENVDMATKRPTRRRQVLEIEPLNWVAPETSNVKSEDGSDADDQQDRKKETAKS